MTFDENSIAHIMGVLTDLYSDDEMAIIREYSTNAYDSHIEAGQTRPIEITTPTALNQILKIQDWGVGMSREDVVHTYLKYGASTKRNTNSQNGTLGLGCKSALTHTDQFTVRAIKNGIKTVINVSRVQDGTGQMELVDTVPTTESNGVTIEIPVKNYLSVSEKAYKFFSYWNQDHVLINGKKPSTVDGTVITDDIMLTDNSHDIIVMGGVAYEVSRDYNIIETRYWGYKSTSLIAWVPIGSVDFAPSREGLRYTALTLNTIKSVRQKFLSAVNDSLKDQVNKCSTAADALAKVLSFNNYSDIKGVITPDSWRGTSIPVRINFKYGIKFNKHAHRYQTDQISYIDRDAISSGTIITGYSSTGSLASYNKEKIRELTRDDSNGTVYIVNEDTLSNWFDNATVYTWDDVKAVKLSSGGTGKRAAMGSQPIYIWDGTNWKEVDEIDESRPIYYLSPTEVYDYRFAYMDDDDQILKLGKNRWDKLKREYPSAQHMNRSREIKCKEFLDSVPDDVVESLTLRDRDLLATLDEDLIDDPQLKDSIKLAKLDASKWMTKYNWFSYKFDNHGYDLGKKYPLLDLWMFRQGHRHMYLYINAVYNEGK